MQHTQTSGENAAVEAWASIVAHTPKWIVAILSVAGAILGYFLNGHAVVAFVRWLVRVAGYVAESALILATTYVILNSVAHILLTWLMPGSWIATLNYLSLVAFSVLPELIVASAILMTIDHWKMVERGQWKFGPAWVWAILYTVPTSAFVVMTVITIVSFTNTMASSGTALQATGTALTVRVLSGWAYALFEILFASKGKKSYTSMLDNLRAVITDLRATVAANATVLADNHKAITTLTATVSESATEVGTLRATLIDRDRDIEALRATVENQLQELQALRSARPRALQRTTLLRGATINGADSYGHRSAQGEQHSDIKEANGNNGIMAVDDGQTMALSDDSGATIMATGEPRERIKAAMIAAMHKGEELNLKEIAQIANAGYSTVRKHAKAIIEEIESEITTGEHAAIDAPAQA